MAYDTAARVQELCDLNVADIRAANPITVTIRGKGSKTRYVPLMEPTAQLVLDYLEHVDPHPSLDADTSPLFHGPHHSRLTRSGIAKLLVRHVRAVRARDPSWAPSLPITPTRSDAPRAMHLIQAGVNLIYIRDLLGHADVATTEVYARADAETKRKAIENAYEPLTPDALPDWTADPSLIDWLDWLDADPTRHVMRTKTTPNSPVTSRNSQTGRITPASTKWRLCGIPHNRHTFRNQDGRRRRAHSNTPGVDGPRRHQDDDGLHPLRTGPQ